MALMVSFQFQTEAPRFKRLGLNDYWVPFSKDQREPSRENMEGRTFVQSDSFPVSAEMHERY
jgi:hypothetical protein